MKHGKTGSKDVISTIALVISVLGLFSYNSVDLYRGGNTTYISLPVGIIIAFLAFLLATLAMKKTGSGDFTEMLSFGLGKVIGKSVIFILLIAIVLYSCLPLTRFLNILHSNYFANSHYNQLVLFAVPAIVIFSLWGFETISRSAKLLALFILFFHAAVMLNTYAGYETYKIFPLFGNGLVDIAGDSVILSGIFLPVFITLMCMKTNVYGTASVKKIGFTSSVIGILICGITQLVLSFLYTAKDLEQLYCPLYNMSNITVGSNSIFHLGRGIVFFWLAAVIIACSFLLFGASYMYGKCFNQKDIRPAAVGIGAIIMSLITASHSGTHFISQIFVFFGKYGFIIVFIPVVISSAAALIKADILAKKGRVFDEG